MKFSLSIKINAIIIVVTTIVLLFFGAYEWQKTKAKLTDELNFSLENSTEQLAAALAYPVWVMNRDGIKEFIELEMRNKAVYAVTVSDSSNNVLVGQVRDTNWQLTDLNPANFSPTPLSKTLPIIRENEKLGTVAVYVTAEFMNEELSQTIMNIVIRQIVMLLLIVITLATFIQITITRPLEQMTGVFNIIAKGNLDQPVNISRADEIGQLAKSFAIMQGAIKEKITELKEYQDSLEQKVIARIHELTEANHKLGEQNIELEAQSDQLQEQAAQLEEKTIELESQANELQNQAAQLRQANEIAEQAKQKADFANKAKSEFLSSMSHELRTPLNGILGYAQILKRNKDLNTLQKDGLNIIQQSGEHLLTLINDILDLAKIEAGKMELYPTDFNFSDFLHGVAGIMRVRAQQKGIGFDLAEIEPLPKAIHGDEKRLRQILINLLNNAVKFTDKGSVTLRIRSKEYEVRSKEETSLLLLTPYFLLRFEVIDTGVGIKPEDIGKLFRAFEQVGDTQRRSEGTGLGLAITYKLIQSMNSELQVKSEFGKGSNFWFEVALPFTTNVVGASKDSIEKQIIGYKGQPRKVLVVDDKQHNRSVLVNLLEPLGFEMFETDNGHDGIKLAQQHKPDLILMDMIMPMMTGFEATQEIRKISYLSHVIVLGVSASTFESDKQRVMTAGCNAFISKPVEIKELLETIQEFLQIEWVYEELTEPAKIVAPQATGLVTPPPTELQALLDLATLGDMRGVRKRLTAMEQLGEPYKPFIEKVTALAKGYEDKQIVALVKEYLEIA